MNHERDDAIERLLKRRRFIRGAAAGSTLFALGGLYYFSDTLTREARAQTRADGRPRLPPGQRVIERLKPMGGQPGDPNPANYRLKVHGEVEAPYELDFAGLLTLQQLTVSYDVHCVTGWSVLGAKWTGVSLLELAKRARVKESARNVIFEAAHGYTANVPRKDALQPNVMVVHRLDDLSLPRTHGGPARGLVPDLYFWKSAKWLTGIRFVQRDEPGYWETRGYHNHADPWKEERYS
jgi:DMSO/TMAO reductase YedYZ molybdopterin-dependent catalytic subunit